MFVRADHFVIVVALVPVELSVVETWYMFGRVPVHVPWAACCVFQCFDLGLVVMGRYVYVVSWKTSCGVPLALLCAVVLV